MKGINRRQLLWGGLGLLGAGALARSARMRFGPALEELLDTATQKVDPKTAGRFVWNPAYAVPWFDNPAIQAVRPHIPNPTAVEKYRLLKRRLVSEGGLSEADFSGVVAMTPQDFGRVHKAGYLEKLRQAGNDPTILPEIMALFSETPITADVLRLQGAFVNGTYTAAQIALAQGVAMNIGGGLHHAMPESEEGFCIFNDVGIAIKRLLHEGSVQKVMIIDADVHHGDGNARIFYSNDNVAIADIYQENNYPGVKIPVDYEVAIDTNNVHVDDRVYLGILPEVLDGVAQVQPDVVFYLAGADPFTEDRLGDFHLSKEGLQMRDHYIVQGVRDLGIPVVVTLAGGYAKNPDDLVDIHYNTAKVVKEV